jgi:ABC-type histidine transport system ATPase subunit
MDEGVIVEEGPPAQLMERPRTDRLRDFLAQVL